MSSDMADLFADDGLFSATDLEREPSALLRDRYVEPPFSVLDRRGKDWQARDKKWKGLGIQSELGRDDAITYMTVHTQYGNWYDVKNAVKAALGVDTVTDQQVLDHPLADTLKEFNGSGGTSLFSPTLVELLVRWYSREGDRVADPFAGGSVRGVVSGVLGRRYEGMDLSGRQVEANREQGDLVGADGVVPTWHQGDSANDWGFTVEPGYDMVLSCPPYAHLEVYSDDPADLSNMPYPAFLDLYRRAIADVVAGLADNRFVAWVIGEVREKGGDGSLVGMVADTVQAFRDAGADLYNDHILVTPVGTAAILTPKRFNSTRKHGRHHEYVLVFVKGDGKAAAKRLGEVR